ncbi:MAG: type IV pilus twitching motility protein PilT [Candidatus Bruticola sp.]
MEVNESVLQELLSKVILLCDHFTENESEAATVPYKLPQLLDIAVAHGASALNINVGSAPTLRINNMLSVVEGSPLNDADCHKLLQPVLSGYLKNKLTRDGHAETCVAGGGAGFKVHLFLERSHVCASFHRLRTDIPKLETLGLSGSLVENILEQPGGLILLTGLPRSGKINTLAALVSHINSTRLTRIVTLEKPIQFWRYNQLSTVLQREVGIDVASFTDGIQQALNQDADVLGLSEIPDRETAAQAIRAATANKLVIAVLDATSPSQGIERILASFNDKERAKMAPIFANALRIVLHQTLVNRSDGRGVIPAFEILVNNDEIHQELNNGKTDKLAWIMQNNNMQTLAKSLSRLVAAGLVYKDEALHYVTDPAELQIGEDSLANLGDYDSEPATGIDTSDTPLMSWL